MLAQEPILLHAGPVRGEDAGGIPPADPAAPRDDADAGFVIGPEDLLEVNVFELPELKYPGRMNCATELLDKPVTRGHGHRIALRTPDGECTYTQLFTQANRIANVLVREMGLKPGNRVLLRGPNNPMMAACWFGVMKAGGVCVATMPLLRAKELTDIIQNAEITHALCDRRLAEELQSAQAACPSLREIKYWYDEAPDSLDTLVMSTVKFAALTVVPLIVRDASISLVRPTASVDAPNSVSFTR